MVYGVHQASWPFANRSSGGETVFLALCLELLPFDICPETDAEQLTGDASGVALLMRSLRVRGDYFPTPTSLLVLSRRHQWRNDTARRHTGSGSAGVRFGLPFKAGSLALVGSCVTEPMTGPRLPLLRPSSLPDQTEHGRTASSILGLCVRRHGYGQ